MRSRFAWAARSEQSGAYLRSMRPWILRLRGAAQTMLRCKRTSAVHCLAAHPLLNHCLNFGGVQPNACLLRPRYLSYALPAVNALRLLLHVQALRASCVFTVLRMTSWRLVKTAQLPARRSLRGICIGGWELGAENGGSGIGACAPLAMLRSARKPSATALHTARCA